MPKQLWTETELTFLRENWGKIPRAEIARCLGRSLPSISNKAGILGLTKKKPPRWTKEDVQFLRENWGKKSLKAICRKLGRTKTGVKIKAKKLKLGLQRERGKFMLSEVCNMLHTDHRKLKKHIGEGRLQAGKAAKKTSRGKPVLVFTPAALERFLREHPEAWDSRRVDTVKVLRAIRERELEAAKEEIRRKEGVQKRKIPEHLRLAFAKFVADVAVSARDRIKTARNPEWLKKKREQDQARQYPRECLPWTREEDERLRQMFQEGSLTYREMGEHLGRSENAVGNRLARIVVWGAKEVV